MQAYIHRTLCCRRTLLQYNVYTLEIKYRHGLTVAILNSANLAIVGYISIMASIVNQLYFLGGGENTSGHTCTTLLAGRNLVYVIIQITLTAKTNLRYVKNVFTLRSKLRHTEQTFQVRGLSLAY